MVLAQGLPLMRLQSRHQAFASEARGASSKEAHAHGYWMEASVFNPMGLSTGLLPEQVMKERAKGGKREKRQVAVSFITSS